MTTLGVTAQQLNELSKPIPKSLVKVDKSRGKPVSYITARTVMNWLDHAVGRANWKTEYRTILDRNQSTKPPTPLTIECTLSIYIDGQWVGKADVGTEDNYSPEKAAYSNALKRAGAQWGIARELYGEGNVHEEDADEPTPEPEQASESKPEPAAKKRQSKPAPKNAAPDDGKPHWTSAGRMAAMLDWAHNTVWEGAINRAHAINRMAAALGIQGTPDGDFNGLVKLAAAQCANVSAEDAQRRIQTYEPASDGTQAAA